MGSVVEQACFRAALPLLEIKNQPVFPNTNLFVTAALTGNVPSTRRSPHLLGGEGREPQTRRERRRRRFSGPSITGSPRKSSQQHIPRTQRSPVKPLISFYSTILCSPQSPPGAAGGGRQHWGGRRHRFRQSTNTPHTVYHKLLQSRGHHRHDNCSSQTVSNQIFIRIY